MLEKCLLKVRVVFCYCRIPEKAEMPEICVVDRKVVALPRTTEVSLLCCEQISMFFGMIMYL